jgi:hypothetical protein
MAALLLISVIGGFFACSSSTPEFSQCFASFETREAAERAASVASDAGFDAEVEADTPFADQPNSPGARQISVTFSDGATGDDAAEFRRVFHSVVAEENGKFGHPNRGCLERGPFI